jgi:hypothetical protein
MNRARTGRLAPWRLAAVVLVVAVAGCAAGTLRELDGLKRASAAGDHAAIAATTIGCTGGPGCAQAHAIKADSCLALARDATLAARAEPAACARTSYDRALAARADDDDPRVDAGRLRANRLEAIRLERDAVAVERGLALNAELARRAEDVAGSDAPHAAFYSANAIAFEVAFGDVGAPCDALAEAAARAEAAGGDELGEAVPQLRRDIANLRRLEGCAG